MDSNKTKANDTNVGISSNNYNPWNLLFKPRQRNNSEHSITSNASSTTQSSSTETHIVQRHPSKEEEYLYMILGVSLIAFASKDQGCPRASLLSRHFVHNRRRVRSIMAALNLILIQHLSLLVSCLCLPAPGRVPKVYNALITSNQNLEPSKAYPVYQPIFQEPSFTFPLQPAYYYGGDFQGAFPVPPNILKDSVTTEKSAEASNASEQSPTTSTSAEPTQDSNPESQNNKGISAPSPPPSTESPIPLNEFGLPPAVLPLGRFDPAYNGFTQFSPFYTYPGFRFYDPFDAYNLNPYLNLSPFYRALPGGPNMGSPLLPPVATGASPSATTDSPSISSTPPPEPTDLNVLNYPSKDPAIPNVPPPPLPQGGLKSDKDE